MDLIPDFLKKKKILCLDFDGVIHSYDSGWQGAENIPDKPVSGAFPFIIEAVETFEVHIYSARSGQEGGIEAMQKWLIRHELPMKILKQIKWPTTKPAAFISLDDRVITFNGFWPKIDALVKFQPWNKKGV